VATPVYLG
jgi:hypothetical protein